MAQDILFKMEEFVFSYRVGGILIRDNKILLQRPKNDDYVIIGGSIKNFVPWKIKGVILTISK